MTSSSGPLSVIIMVFWRLQCLSLDPLLLFPVVSQIVSGIFQVQLNNIILSLYKDH